MPITTGVPSIVSTNPLYHLTPRKGNPTQSAQRASIAYRDAGRSAQSRAHRDGGSPAYSSTSGGSQSTRPDSHGDGAHYTGYASYRSYRDGALAEQKRLYNLLKGAADRRVINQLQSASTRVKAHEQAHMAVLGGAAGGGIHYTYVRGPHGGRYAVAGSIDVDLEPVHGNPEATIKKAKQIWRAALAPANPSAADMKVAAEAQRMIRQARQEIRQQQNENSENRGSDESVVGPEEAINSGVSNQVDEANEGQRQMARSVSDEATSSVGNHSNAANWNHVANEGNEGRSKTRSDITDAAWLYGREMARRPDTESKVDMLV